MSLGAVPLKRAMDFDTHIIALSDQIPSSRHAASPETHLVKPHYAQL